MAVGTRTQRIDAKLEAANVYWGRGECRNVLFVDDMAGDQSGKYFDLNVIEGDGSEKAYYVLLSDGTAVDPMPAGKTKIEVVYTSGDSATTIASLYVTALANVECFVEDKNDGSVDVENWYPGSVSTEDYSNAVGLTKTVEQAGFGGFIGKTSDAISLSMETSTVEIVSDQTGGLLGDEVLLGNASTITANILEMTADRWKSLLGRAAGDFVEGSSSDVVGLGESKLFQNLSSYDGLLILHPIRLGANDRSADWVFWRSVPLVQETSFSGTEPQTLSVEFKAYLDSRINTKVNLAARGDWTQQSDLFV